MALTQKTLSIRNFIHLDDEHYSRIRDYRNQDYIRFNSNNPQLISVEAHEKYREALRKQTHYAFMIQKETHDYGVIMFNKDGDHFTAGDYLVKEEYKFEGGGIANRMCMCYLSEKLGIKTIKSIAQSSNSRVRRRGGVVDIEHLGDSRGFSEYLVEIIGFNDPRCVSSKPRKMFDKLYIIGHVEL